VNTEAEDKQHYGYHSEKGALVKRLHRIEGQVRGLERMVTDDTASRVRSQVATRPKRTPRQSSCSKLCTVS
jgi:hypothetical protein